MITFPQLEQFLSDLRAFISDSLNPANLSVSAKKDATLVTHIDTAISEFCKNHPFCVGNFHSEEEHSGLQYPAVVLDPIDGTKELIKGNGECVVSIAWMNDSRNGEALIYNPYSGFRLTTFDTPAWTPENQESPLLGLVSRSEMPYLKVPKEFNHQLVAKGSIAFKLALLASGGADFVISLKPKNIWDVAAGTILCWQRGFVFYSKGKLVTELSQDSYEPPLIWGRPNVVKEVSGYSFFP